MLRHIRHKDDLGVNTINQLIDEINAARNIKVSGGMYATKAKNGMVLSAGTGTTVYSGGGGSPAIWAEVIRSPLYADAEGDPPEGHDDFVLSLTDLTEWTQGTYSPGTVRKHNEAIWEVVSAEDTTEEPGVGADWEEQTGINPQHQDFGAVDWRHFAPWPVVERHVELVIRGGVYYFRSPPMRVYDSVANRQSIMYNEDQERVMAVYS